jgi:16S rRNA A1518/A1519 N6-dimethyltransferase RsmA/KsgA/DIM1 with predicted DNA glycosylase/AP lyase activity
MFDFPNIMRVMYPYSYLLGLNRFLDGAWYEPSLDDRIGWALKLLEIKSGDLAVDIGSGDGRVVIEMAKQGAIAIGIEKNPVLVETSRQNIYAANLTNRARIIHGFMLQQSYKQYNKVFIYQFKTVIGQLETQLFAELPIGARVVSNYWKFPHWPVSAQLEDVYLYLKK